MPEPNRQVYIAASFNEKDAAARVARNLLSLGINVSKWQFSAEAEEPSSAEERRKAFEENIADLRQSDAVLYLPTDQNQGRCALVEVGYALALGMPVYVLGPAVGIHDSQMRLVTSLDEFAKTLLSAGVKRSAGKADYTLIPWELVPKPPSTEYAIACGELWSAWQQYAEEDWPERVLPVLEYGARKYDRENWKKVPADMYRLAALRHLRAYLRGDLLDGESGLSHRDHFLTCLLLANR
jgi:nucleoside 2-deoxyribosyltransferase